ncbi:IS1182 family transposase [Desulfitobacterium sp. AusDCA]|uniref:IS1182 family transposase n=1 Tax=Desulfitobacterium sp. AusDCA TaxID=3240383 RepID=UPI003DA775E3
MYIKKDRGQQKQFRMVCIEDLVPQNHILRDIDRAIDFNFIYDAVKGLYSEIEWGKPGIDPVSLFKIVLIQFLFGIRSMRQTIKEIEVNMAYRWFIGYDLGESIPHFSTFGKNYTRRFKDTDVFQKIFEQILNEAVRCGFVDASALFIDGTHIKASANKHNATEVVVEKQAKQYQKQLEEEIEKDRAAHGKKPLKKDKDDDSNSPPPAPKTQTIKQSKVDPESGVFHKGEHEKCFAYVANTACDRHNFILNFVLGAGNLHDSVMFDRLYEKVVSQFPESKVVAVDSGYKTPWIMKQIIDSERVPAVPYKRPMTKEGFFKKYEYVYDEYYDCILCPQNQVLKYSTTNREGYREYKSNPEVCESCPVRSQCTGSKAYQKVVIRHVWEPYMEQAEEYRYMPQYKAIYKLRSETIERVFADAKEKHGMRYTQLRGLQKVKMQVTLTFACMNLKKLATWKRRKGILPPFSRFRVDLEGLWAFSLFMTRQKSTLRFA